MAGSAFNMQVGECRSSAYALKAYAGFKGCCMALIDPAYEERIIETVAREYLKVFPMLKGKYSAHFEKWAEIKPQKITVVGDGTDTDETRLGAVKDIRFAIEQLCIDDDMLVIVGDNVLNFSMTRFIAIPKKM